MGGCASAPKDLKNEGSAPVNVEKKQGMEVEKKETKAEAPTLENEDKISLGSLLESEDKKEAVEEQKTEERKREKVPSEPKKEEEKSEAQTEKEEVKNARDVAPEETKKESQ